MLAIMGPSGSGKTSLLNALAYRRVQRLKTSGQIAMNSVEVSRSNVEALSAYVEQEDALIGSLKVRETIDFAARLSLPRCAFRTPPGMCCLSVGILNYVKLRKECRTPPAR